MQSETETDSLICQVQAIKDILDEVEVTFLNPDAFNSLFGFILEVYKKSDERIEENISMSKHEDLEGDEDLDDLQDDQEVLKEENKIEYDLQLSVEELIGIFFKTHAIHCQFFLKELFNTILPAAMNSKEKQKNKFALYMMDDMVEYLGPQYLGSNYLSVARSIISQCSSPIDSIRQGAAYGVGIMAKTGGQDFAPAINESLQGLKLAIEFVMPANVKEKKSKAQ